MIIFVGGLFGSGTQRLAKKLAEDFRYLYYPIRPKIIEQLKLTRAISGQVNCAELQNDFRFKVIREIAEKLPALSKLYDGLVITAPFLREKQRKILFDAAAKTGSILIVWVESSDEDAHRRFSLGGDRLLQQRIRDRMLEKQLFEPFKSSPLLFDNVGTFNDSSRRFREMIIAEQVRLNEFGASEKLSE